MRRYRLSRQASGSLRGIAAYISRESGDLERGIAFVSRLRAQCEKLASLPGLIGRPRPDLGSEVRSFVYNGYSIIFRYGPDTIDILEIIHVRRDRTALMDDD